MNEYKIEIQEDLEETIFNAIKDYWEIEDGKFKNLRGEVGDKYNLSGSELSKLVKNHSKCVMNCGHCEDCDSDIIAEFFSQTRFNDLYSRKKTQCHSCLEKQFERLEHERYLELVRRMNNREANFENVNILEALKKINEEEQEVLNGIVRSQTKRDIYANIFNGDINNRSIWRIVNKLEKVRLIAVIRSPENGKSIIRFDIHPHLLEATNPEPKVEPTNNYRNSEALSYFRFHLAKNYHKTIPRQPNYTGTFIPKIDIVLKAGVKYIYGGWENTDESISVKIQPLEDVKPSVIQSSIKEAPEHIKDVLDKMSGEDEW